MADATELIRYVAAALVDNSEAVQVKMVEQEDAVVIELTVAKEDLGKVIGKQGRTARAMRALLTEMAGKESKRLRLDIME